MSKKGTNDKKIKGAGLGNSLTARQKVALVLWAALIFVVLINRDKITIDTLLSLSPSNLWLAALAMIGLFALKTLSVVFYSGILFTLSGVLFSLPVAMAVNTAGIIVMLLEGYAIGHAGGSGLVEDLTEKYPKFAAFTDIKDWSPFAFALLIRMLKVINYDLGSMYMGAAGVPLLPYLGGSIVGILPEAILFALAGSGIASMNAMPALASAAVYVILTLTSVLTLRHMMKK